MSSLVQRLTDVMDRLYDLNDMNRIGHNQSSYNVFTAFAEYLESDAVNDMAVIDEAIATGVTTLVGIYRHRNLKDIKRLNLEPAETLYALAEYVSHYLVYDIDVIDEAIAELREKGVLKCVVKERVQTMTIAEAK